MTAEYGLTRLVLGSGAFVPIGKDGYEEINAAKKGLLQCISLEEKFDLLIENYFEFESTLIESASRYMVFAPHGYTWFHGQRALFNRRTVNLLTAGKTYIDHTKHHVKQIFGDSSDVIKQVDDAFSREYDTRLGYRAMETLRNHVQHRGFPIHSISFGGKWLPERKREKLRHSVSPYLVPRELRAEGKFKKGVLKELEALGEAVGLKFLIRDYVEGLSSVHQGLRRRFTPLADGWKSTLESAMEKFQSQYPNEKMIGVAAVLREGNGAYSREIQIFREFWEHQTFLLSKNGNLVNLTRRFVTSEITEEETIPQTRS